jgi:hypothetical protein
MLSETGVSSSERNLRGREPQIALGWIGPAAQRAGPPLDADPAATGLRTLSRNPLIEPLHPARSANTVASIGGPSFCDGRRGATLARC